LPLYDFQCKCGERYEEFASYDETGKYPTVICPKCKSKKKTKLIPDKIRIVGPTSSKMDNFGYRAGYNMEKAKTERRAAEEASHMGGDPYAGSRDPDANLDEGLHHFDSTPQGRISDEDFDE
jgi:hypothetical protein